MITRAMQRMSCGKQTCEPYSNLLFNTLVQSWVIPGSGLGPISYSSGIFSIPNASQSDYLITWDVSVKVSNRMDGFSDTFLLYMNYGNGEVSEENFATSITSTGLIRCFKIIHVIRINTNKDLLQFYIVNRTFYNTMYMQTPSQLYSYMPEASEIANCNICVFSI